LRIEVREEIPEDSELRRAWNELALRMESPQVFYSYEWAVAVQRAYGSVLKPLLFLAYEAESLVGVVALAQEQNRSGLSFLTANTGDYCDFITDPGRRREFVEVVLSQLGNRNIRNITLTNLPADSSSVPAIASVSASRHFHLHSRQAYLCARVVPGSTEERVVLKQAVAGKKRLRRNVRELEKLGRLNVRHDTQWEEIEPILAPFGRAHVARFLATGRISSQVRPERRKFLYELARELSRSGWVTVSRLLVGETPAAWNYGFQFAGSWFWYQPTVNSIYEEFSPGYCLLAKIVQLACESTEIQVVDLGLGAEDYKDRFATANRETLYLALNRSFWDHVRTAARDKVAATGRISPRIECWIRSTLSSIVKFRACLRESGVVGLLKRFSRRTWNSLFGFDAVLFFEWPVGTEERQGPIVWTLRRLDSDLVGGAAIRYADDPETLEYLMRSAHRLRSEGNEGFALIDTEGMPVHFCWAKEFEGFGMAELNRTLSAPCPEAVMIFDCHTPAEKRGQGFFAAAITALANHLRAEGKSPWIFGASTNRNSLRGIERAGFVRRFTLGRKRMFCFEKVKDSIPFPNPAAGPVSAP